MFRSSRIGRQVIFLQRACAYSRGFFEHTKGFGESPNRKQNRSTQTMSDVFLYTYPSPLEGYEDHKPLPDELNEDGKSYKNEQTGVLSPSYEKFTSGITNGRRGGFDVHIYYHHNSEAQKEYAQALWERIRLEFPELR